MMIAKNTSGYQTRAIRAVITLAHQHIRSYERVGAPMWSELRITVRGRKGGHTSGCAVIGGNWMCLTLPRKDLTARRLLWIAYHELMHSFGYTHRQYRDLTDAELAALVPTDYVIPSQLPVVRPDRKLARVGALIARRDAWQSKLRRAQTALKEDQPQHPLLRARTADADRCD